MKLIHIPTYVSILACTLALPAMGELEEDFADAKYLMATERDHALELFTRVVSAPGEHKDLSAQALVFMGDIYRVLGVPKHAETSYNRVLKEFSDQKAPVPDAHLGMGETYRMSQEWQKALEWFQKAVPQATGIEAKLLIAYQRVAEAHENLKQVPEAIGAYETLLKIGGLLATTRNSALNQLALLYSRANDAEKAIQTYERVVSENSQAPPATAILALKEIAKLRRKQGKFDEAVTAYRRLIILEPLPNPTYITYLNQPTVAAATVATYLNYLNALVAQKEIVITYLEAGKYDDAVRAAVAFMNVTRMAAAAFSVGVETVGWTLKAREGNLVLANTFIQFQNLGPAGTDGKKGTGDDLTSPLPVPVKTKANEKIPEILAEAISEIPPRESNQHRQRGFLALYGEAPLSALKEFRAAYRECEVHQAKVKAAVDDIGVAVAALEGHSTEAQPVFVYQQHGPAGPDGKIGTADDLKDPLLKYLAQ